MTRKIDMGPTRAVSQARTSKLDGVSRSVISPSGSPLLLAMSSSSRGASVRSSSNVDTGSLDLPVVQDAISLLLLVRAENSKVTTSVRTGQLKDAKEIKKGLEEARKIALKAAEEAAEKAGFWGDLLSVVKVVAVAAAAVATVATGGLSGVALAGAVLMLVADHVPSVLKEMGLELSPDAAKWLSFALKVTGAVMTLNVGAMVQAGGEGAALFAESVLSDQLPPEFMMVVTGIAVASAILSMVLGGGGGAKTGLEGATSSTSSSLSSALGEMGEALQDIAKQVSNVAKWIYPVALLTQGVSQGMFSYFQNESEQKDIDAKGFQLSKEQMADIIERIVDLAKSEMKSLSRFKKSAADILSLRNDASAAATRNMA